MSDQLRSIFARWLALELNKAEISDASKDLFAEARGNGFDVKALRLAFRTKVKDSEPQSEADKATAAMVETYLAALEEKPRARPAPARVEIIEETATNTSGESRERQRPVRIASPPVSKPEAPPVESTQVQGPSGTAATESGAARLPGSPSHEEDSAHRKVSMASGSRPDEDIPTFLQRGHPDNSWVRQ